MKRPTMDETEARQAPERDAPLDTLTYWALREEWERLGREVGEFRTRAKAAGVPIEMLTGAGVRISRFKALGHELDRRTR